MWHEKNSLSFFAIFLLFRYCISIDTISPDQLLKDGDILISKGENFTLGFFSPINSSRRYVGIWYHKVSEQTIVWVANRDVPFTDTSGVLSIDRNGNLVLFHSQQPKVPLWSTNITPTAVSPNYSAQLLDSGNLVVFHSDSNKVVAWQSFDYPTDTFLPTMKLGVDRRLGLDRFLTSWKSPEDPGTGDFYYKFDINGSVPQLFLYQGLDRYWRGGPWNGFRLSGIPQMSLNYIFDNSYVDNDDEVAILYGMLNPSIISRMVVNESAGIIERLTWHEGDKKWVGIWSAPEESCDYYAHCGVFGHCNPYVNVGDFECKCLPGFQPKSKGDWYLRDGSAGCVRKRVGQVCGNGDGFVKVARAKVPDTSMAERDMSLDIKACEKLCLRNCSCTGYATANIKLVKGCITWYGELIDLREFSNGGQDFYIRVDAIELAQYSKKSRRIHGSIKVVIGVLCLAAVLLIFPIAYRLVMKKKRGTAERSHRNLLFSHNSNSQASLERYSNVEEINGTRTTADVHSYSLNTIIAATDNFSLANKVGEGGFGSVYKGILHNGQEIAVKRSSNSSGQGIEEFRNEVTLIAKLQHRNLVRLLGYCIQKGEKMLIYEYLPNKGLDCFIFDKDKRSMLNWRKRFDITLGIARGMVYLHHNSRLRIIHRDLKASNVLLDASMNPKISDFGMARIFGSDKLVETTKRVVGTYGYMAPEYAMEGHFSIKSDVFSFGVLLLEIFSGTKNNSYYQEDSVNLIGHVWDLWREGKALQIVDSSLGESYDRHDDEILRCIHIGLLCVQESPNVRPTMSEVAVMLSNQTSLSAPSQPAFIFRQQNNHLVNPRSTSPVGISVNDVTVSMVVAR